MKYIIDDKICLKHKLTFNEFLACMLIKNHIDIDLVMKNLQDRGILVNNRITSVWQDTIEEILCQSNGGITNEERLANLAQQMRECFPEGKMQGTAFYYRCNNREVILKLKKFFETYGNYSDEKIIDATKRFVASFNGNYRYLPLIKYFISKQKTYLGEDGMNHATQVSELASYLENKEDTVNSDDWMFTSRN